MVMMLGGPAAGDPAIGQSGFVVVGDTEIIFPIVFVVVIVVSGGRGGITFGGTSTGVTVLAVALDMEAAIDVVIVSALLLTASGVRPAADFTWSVR